MLDVGPCGDDGAQNHESKREQGEAGDRTPEPQYLAVSNEDNGQVLEDSVHRDGEVLKRLGAGIDHAD